jgi:uncharacterized repeat protein (TIGR01451 family)
MEKRDDLRLHPDTPLARQLRWYGTAAVAAGALATQHADAQVVHTDVDPDEIIQNATRPVDFDDDGDPELLLRERSGFYCCPRLETTDVGDEMVGAAYFRVPVGRGRTSYTPFASRLSEGSLVGPSNCDTWYLYDHVVFTYGSDPEAWIGAGPHFAGVQLSLDGATHFGYLEVEMVQSGQIIFRAYAFEATPDTPIEAGATDTIVLDGSVNQTTFPPEGGTLVYTFAVSNTGPNPAPLDLSVKARQNGVAVLTRLLASGTLPAGATVTRSVSLSVPASAPEGEYRVTFRVGDFEGGLNYAAETFTITKEPGAAAGDAVAAGGALTVEALPGDLFTGVAPADAATPATHALSAPVPNPSTGRAAFTLDVVETQAVRVEVLDALGRRVAVLHNGPLQAGTAHRLAFEGSALPAGVYAVRAVGETFADVRTLTLTR